MYHLIKIKNFLLRLTKGEFYPTKNSNILLLQIGMVRAFKCYFAMYTN